MDTWTKVSRRLISSLLLHPYLRPCPCPFRPRPHREASRWDRRESSSQKPPESRVLAPSCTRLRCGCSLERRTAHADQAARPEARLAIHRRNRRAGARLRCSAEPHGSVVPGWNPAVRCTSRRQQPCPLKSACTVSIPDERSPRAAAQAGCSDSWCNGLLRPFCPWDETV